MHNPPHISVVMTFYNEEAFIGEALDSIMAQTALEAILEIIVIDDGSKEESAAALDEIAKKYPLVKVVHIENRGLPGARNVGFDHARAPFVALLDSDDIWHPEKIALQTAQLAKSGERVGLWYGDFRQFRKSISDSVLARVRKIGEADENVLRDYFIYDAPIIPSTVILRTSAVIDVGKFYEQAILFEDQDMWLRLAAGGWKFQHVPGALLYKRLHEKSLAQSQFDKWLLSFAQIESDWTAKRPELKTYLRRRHSWRYARLANLALLRGWTKVGLKLLARSWVANPFNARIYMYAAIALLPGQSRAGLTNSLKRALRGRS